VPAQQQSAAAVLAAAAPERLPRDLIGRREIIARAQEARNPGSRRQQRNDVDPMDPVRA
jgi:hypothetical protein